MSPGISIHPSTDTVTAACDPLVLLHGWGFDGASMAPLIEPLRALGDVWVVDLPGFGCSPAPGEYTPETIVAVLARYLPVRAVLVGWSLGGMLALAYAAAKPERVSALVTLASNACFVARQGWPHAMAPAINNAFNQDFSHNPEATAQRFISLVAQGSVNERALIKALRQLHTAPITSAWLPALHCLAASDNRAALAELAIPCLHLLGQRDALVPAVAGDALAALNPLHQIDWLDTCHALHWDLPEIVAARIVRFVGASRPPMLDKLQVARSFSRAAYSYDALARLQRQVGESLLMNLDSGTGGTLLDLGTGTGYFTQALRQRCLPAVLVGLDLAEGMLNFARSHHNHADYWLCADAEVLPIAGEQVDRIFSSLAIQWCEDLTGLFAELMRVLAPGGRVDIATLGPGTLTELADAWRSVDAYVHVNRFATEAQLEAAALEAGFARVSIKSENYTLFSENLRALSRELKGLGAHNVNRGRPAGLTGPGQLQRLEAAYDRHRQSQGLPATYQVIYLQLQKAG